MPNCAIYISALKLLQLTFFIFTARCYAERGYEILGLGLCRLSVHPSLCLSVFVTFRCRDHIGWNTSKIISRPNSLRSLLTLTPAWAVWYNGNTPKIRME